MFDDVLSGSGYDLMHRFIIIFIELIQTNINIHKLSLLNKLSSPLEIQHTSF